MRTSGSGVELIKSFEGFRARATRLPNGKWIVGFGHTESAREGLRVTRADAELVLRHHDLKPIETLIGAHVLTPLTQNEFDALVSFAFNIGPEAFLDSNVLSLLNSGERLQAAEGMSAWRKGRVDGQVRIIDALVRRRAAEKALFLEHPSGRIPVPGALVRPLFDAGAAGEIGREQAVVIEARTEGDRTSAARPQPQAEASPQAAARAVAERMTRLLGEKDNTTRPEAAQMAGVPTADEITRAVSALAEPNGPGEDRVPDNVIEARRMPPRPAPPASAGAATGPKPAEAFQPKLTLNPPRQPVSNGFAGMSVLRWLPYMLLSGLGLVGVFEGVRRTIAPPVSQFQGDSGVASAGALLAFGSAMVCVMAIYYLYRALTRQD